MSRYALCLLLSAGWLFAAGEPNPEAVKKLLDPLQGTWKVVSIENNGRQIAEEQFQGFHLVIAQERMTFQVETEMKASFKLHADTNPLAIDIELSLGKDGKNKRNFEGICQVDGDTFKLCWHNIDGSKQRPDEFSAKADSNRNMWVFKRAKP